MTPLKFLIILSVVTIVVTLVMMFFIFDSTSYGMPSLDMLENPKQNFASQVFSSDGELLDHFYIQRRVSLAFDSIPQNFVNALIATEDKKFYSHWGVHLERIFKAIVKDILSLHFKEGGSTITMQLSRNLYFSQANTLSRKIKEALTAVQIEKTYTKDEILEMYINTVNFGRGAYGIQVASQVYFDKQPKELTLSECAFLVGLLKAPEHYNGGVDYDKAVVRRNLVLSLMRDQQYVTPSDFAAALDEPITLSKNKLEKRGTSLLAPHFVEMIRQQLSKDGLMKGFDLYRDGLIISTTLNAKIQKYAREAVDEHFKEFQKIFNKSFSWSKNQSLLEDLISKGIRNRADYVSATDNNKKIQIERSLKKNRKFIDSVKNSATTIQCGLVVMDPMTGEVLAMVGASPKFMEENSDFKYSLNHVTQIKRQPGSSFKPFVYASSLEEGLEPNTTIDAGPFSYTMPDGKIWSPRGSAEGDDGGNVTLREALARSINTVAARLITQHTSPQKVIALARKMGIQSPLIAVPALGLGAGGDVSPFELTNAYGTFANEGIHTSPYTVKKIEDQFGNVLLQNKRGTEVSDALKPKYARAMVSMMQGVVDAGTGREVRNYFKNCDAAGKTGTTNDFADAWFVGYTPQLVAGVWVGFDDRRITFTGGYGYAAKAAAPIWGRLMAKIYSDESLPYKQRKFAFIKSDTTDTVSNVQALNHFKKDVKSTAVNENKKDLVSNKSKMIPIDEADKKKKFALPKLTNLTNDQRKRMETE